MHQKTKLFLARLDLEIFLSNYELVSQRNITVTKRLDHKYTLIFIIIKRLNTQTEKHL